MLKITIRVEAGIATIALEGKLAGPWVKELECSWRGTADTYPTLSLRVNLSDVTFIDQEGESLLAGMHCHGVELVAERGLNHYLVREIIVQKKQEGSS